MTNIPSKAFLGLAHSAPTPLPISPWYLGEYQGSSRSQRQLNWGHEVLAHYPPCRPTTLASNADVPPCQGCIVCRDWQKYRCKSVWLVIVGDLRPAEIQKQDKVCESSTQGYVARLNYVVVLNLQYVSSSLAQAPGPALEPCRALFMLQATFQLFTKPSRHTSFAAWFERISLQR